MAKVAPHSESPPSPMKEFAMRLEDDVRMETPQARGEQPPSKATVALDGFLLLDTCRVEFPEEASRADVNGHNITAVVADDLQYFTNLLFLDMSDNQAPLEPLGALPALKELDFQCNALHKVSNLVGFTSLEWLNLSFNCLVGKDVEELSKLPKLRELYLASNWITSVPPIMDRFARLETLSLERNNIQGTGVFLLLAVMPRLKNLNLSHNKITEFPINSLALNDKQGAGYYHLAYLNLAHNKIAREEDIFSLTQLRVLSQLVLYGNPLAHAAVQTQDKTKLLYNPVPAMTECCADGRDVDLNIVVAYPETKRKKPSYKNVQIARVKQDALPTCAEFRARGKRALFPPAHPDRVTSIFPPRVQPQEDEPPPEALPAEPDMTFLTGVGIESSGLPRTRRRPAKEPVAVENDVPAYFLARSLAPNSETQQVKLKTAMATLRYQLAHPLTSHNDRLLDLDVSAVRPTALHKLRQRKKHGEPAGRFALASIDRAIDDVNARLHNRVDLMEQDDASLNHLVRQAHRMGRNK
ncbi:hypothetical protein ACHHYP_12695 [Achlya hypogyna]|uniref:Uncharacterized protein n=1 Tax=Achlya hypogyna TaxID=1202772 RepID=A0A1V9ZGP9_ACHHY|nr:hypothetical protein ACHHYP_12695 [Achlya hypogyna]